jgi:hypothetical protein
MDRSQGWDERRCARSRHGPNALSATSQGWDLTSYGATDLVKLHLNHPIILSQSGKYSVVIGDGISGTQNGWRFCQNCYKVSSISGNPDHGRCPAGGSHDGSASGSYSIIDSDQVPGTQSGWRFWVLSR